MTLQVDLNNSPTAVELEQIFGPARENAQALIAELDELALKAGQEAVANIKDPLLSSVCGVFRTLVGPFRSND